MRRGGGRHPQKTPGGTIDSASSFRSFYNKLDTTLESLLLHFEPSPRTAHLRTNETNSRGTALTNPPQGVPSTSLTNQHPPPPHLPQNTTQNVLPRPRTHNNNHLRRRRLRQIQHNPPPGALTMDLYLRPHNRRLLQPNPAHRRTNLPPLAHRHRRAGRIPWDVGFQQFTLRCVFVGV